MLWSTPGICRRKGRPSHWHLLPRTAAFWPLARSNPHFNNLWFTVKSSTRIFSWCSTVTGWHFCSFSLCTSNLLWGKVSSYFCVPLFGWFSSYCSGAFLVIWRQWKIRDKRCRAGEEESVRVYFFSPCLWSRNICWKPQTAEFSNTTSRCQATLLPSVTFTAEEINQSGNKEWRKFRKKCQKPNLSRIKWIRTLLVFGEANWNMFLTHVNPLCHCCLRNFVITKLLWAKDLKLVRRDL